MNLTVFFTLIIPSIIRYLLFIVYSFSLFTYFLLLMVESENTGEITPSQCGFDRSII